MKKRDTAASPADDVLNTLHSLIEEPNRVEDGAILLPRWRVRIRPEVAQLEDRMAVLNVHLTCPDWDRRLFECSAALGRDKEQALGMAVGGFLFCMLDGVAAMEDNREPGAVESVFEGQTHRWRCYQSNLVGMGDTPKEYTAGFWDLLGADLTRRLGNQKLCYVKVFVSKNGDEITGECRINDEVSAELGEKVAGWARAWKTEGFGSQKQFFFLVQEPETYVPYPYTEEQIRGLTETAVARFETCLTDWDRYGTYVEDLAAEIGDRDLAEEFYAFLPELCAEHAFPGNEYLDQAGICRGDREETFFRSQPASYGWMKRALLDGFASGRFSEETYRAYIQVSSIYSVICSAREQGADLTKGGKITLSFGFSDEYRMR